jgi:hypothetical protein
MCLNACHLEGWVHAEKGIPTKLARCCGFSSLHRGHLLLPSPHVDSRTTFALAGHRIRAKMVTFHATIHTCLGFFLIRRFFTHLAALKYCIAPSTPPPPLAFFGVAYDWHLNTHITSHLRDMKRTTSMSWKGILFKKCHMIEPIQRWWENPLTKQNHTA